MRTIGMSMPLRRCCIAQRGMPSVDPGQPFEPVVVRAVERHDVKLMLDQADERQEVLTVEPVLVEFSGDRVRELRHRCLLRG